MEINEDRAPGLSLVKVEEPDEPFIKVEHCLPSEQPQPQPEKKKPKPYPLNKKRKNQGEHPYHWTKVQQRRYVCFLVDYYYMFILDSATRAGKGLNSSLSRFVVSRDTNQCRCHHAKMIDKYGSVYGVIDCNLNLVSQKYMIKWDRINGIGLSSEELQVK